MGTIFKLYGLRTHIESWGGTPITRFSWYQQKYLWKIKKKLFPKNHQMRTNIDINF